MRLKKAQLVFPECKVTGTVALEKEKLAGVGRKHHLGARQEHIGNSLKW